MVFVTFLVTTKAEIAPNVVEWLPLLMLLTFSLALVEASLAD